MSSVRKVGATMSFDSPRETERPGADLEDLLTARYRDLMVLQREASRRSLPWRSGMHVLYGCGLSQRSMSIEATPQTVVVAQYWHLRLVVQCNWDPRQDEARQPSTSNLQTVEEVSDIQLGGCSMHHEGGDDLHICQ